MKYIVCVKQVPNTSGKVAVKEDGTMDRSKMATIINPDDLNAVEAALALRDRNPDAKVIVVSMGPPPAMGMLHELLAMGADEAVLVSGREFGGSDTFATSQILAGAISHIGLEKDDIVFCFYIRFYSLALNVISLRREIFADSQFDRRTVNERSGLLCDTFSECLSPDYNCCIVFFESRSQDL